MVLLPRPLCGLVLALCLSAGCKTVASAGVADTGHEGSRDVASGVDSSGGHTSDAVSGDVDVAPPLTLPEGLTGGFVELTEGLEDWPPFLIRWGDIEGEREPDVTYGIFADLDGGSTLEVIVCGNEAHEEHRQIYTYSAATGQLEPWTTDPMPYGGVPLAADLDGDGHTDALVASFKDGMNVRWGDPLDHYDEVTELVLGDGTLFDQRSSFHLVDLDGDGWLDFMMNDDCGMGLLFRTGPRTWARRGDSLQEFASQRPYALMSWPVAGRSPVIFALGHPTCGYYSAFEQTQLDADGYPLYEPVSVFDPSAIYDLPSGSSGLISPMGAAAADLDRDGALDLFITLDPAHVILDGALSWPIISPVEDSGLKFMDSDSTEPQLGWGVALVDLDKDGLDDVIVTHGDDFSRFAGTVPAPGPQWATVHLNMGDFRFLDATEHLAMGRRGGWRALTVGDLDGDADPDIIVGGLGEAPHVYRNDIETPNRSLALKLAGRASNRFGIGAHVVVTPVGTDKGQLYAMGAMGGPRTVSTPTIYAGLGTAAGAHVTVTWPSGVVQTVNGLAAGDTHVITEPDILTIEPAGRHLTAGGSDVATLTVRPQSPATSVTAVITHGDGIPEAAVLVDDGVWVLTVTPPTTQGSARIEVRIDGQPLAIRPRLWWDAPEG